MRQDRTKALILELIKKTKNDEIVWNSHSPKASELPNGEIILDKVYESNFGEKSFKIFKYKFKLWRDENDFEWQPSIRIELTDKSGNTDFEFEYDNSFNDLYTIVREQCSNVSDIIDSILGLSLEIVEATYGTLKQTFDITQELKFKIHSNKLNILASNEIKGDPEPGVIKKLKVKFKFGNQVLEKEVIEGQRIILP